MFMSEEMRKAIEENVRKTIAEVTKTPAFQKAAAHGVEILQQELSDIRFP